MFRLIVALNAQRVSASQQGFAHRLLVEFVEFGKQDAEVLVSSNGAVPAGVDRMLEPYPQAPATENAERCPVCRC